MSEAYARFRQYEYRANSNLVLTSENRSRTNEPTGEPESLAGRIQTSSFGDRARPDQAPSELKDRLEKMRKRKRDETVEVKKSKKRKRENILNIDSIHEGYQPKTQDTQVQYEKLLNIIRNALGDQPQDILKDAADGILAILKEENYKASQKKKSIEGLLGSLREEKFSELVQISTAITDYSDEPVKMDEELDEHGVPVVFNDSQSEEEDSDYGDVLKDESESDEEEDEGESVEGKTKTTSAVASKKKNEEEEESDDEMEVDGEDNKKTKALDVKKIDAYWLQRELSTFVKDAHASQKMEQEVMKILANTNDDIRRCENKLVQLLEYKNFGFIQLLLRNRWEIVYCTKLARAKDSQEAAEIEAEMKEVPLLANILQALRKTSGSASSEKTKDIERSIRQQARTLSRLQKLKGGDQSDFTNKDGAGNIKLLDLDNLAFDNGSHFMSNKECKLPAGTQRLPKKGYEEVHVPPRKPPDTLPGERLIPIAELEDWVQIIFRDDKDISHLNRIQSQCYDAAFKASENILMCAPTGSGKTIVALLTMMHEIGKHRRPGGAPTDIDLDDWKIVYIAPMKSLVHEVVLKFSERLKPFGISVKELSGDVNLTKQQISETQVIVTTPEKWDIITRKAGERTYTSLVKLIIIDEIHLLHDDRGPVLECIIARTIRQIETSQQMVRLVGLSATLPNYEDVAIFLRAEQGLLAFNNSYRPVPLEQQYIGITERKPLKRFQLMNEICYEKVVEHAGRHQILIFVHSRKETVKTARAVRDMAIDKDTVGLFLAGSTRSASREILQTEAETTKNAELKDLLPNGFAVHHAGMARADRHLVEDLFHDGHIQVLVSTATLAWGVNLPAHTVIIKGTQVYSPEKGRWTELSALDVMQMIGRAGRPGYDTLGQGIVLTTHTELQYYLSLLNHQLPIESQLIKKLPDHLNAEIVLGSVTCLKDAVEWLGYTYLYVCMLRSPHLYGVPTGDNNMNTDSSSSSSLGDDSELEGFRAELIHTAASLLEKCNLIRYDRKTGAFQATDLGRVASHYYISHTSIAIYNEHLNPAMTDVELFRVFALSEEFKYINVRDEEKGELEKLLDKVPIPVKETMDEPIAKVNVLLQAYISRLKLDGFALVADMVYVTQSAGRIIRALLEIVMKRGWAAATDRALRLSKMIDKRMWYSQSPLRQFGGMIAESVIKRLEKKDFPFERLYDFNSQEIGELVRFPSLGKRIYQAVHSIPKLELSATVQPITRGTLRVDLAITPDFMWEDKPSDETEDGRRGKGKEKEKDKSSGVSIYNTNKAEGFWIFVEDVDGEMILHHEYFILKRKFVDDDHYLNFTVPLQKPVPPQYYIRVVSDRWIGAETLYPISFRHLILPEKYPPQTELLDLQALPITALGNKRFVQLYKPSDADAPGDATSSRGKFVYFNPIQTQVFKALYQKDDNVLIAAPTSSGKTVCAELAILKAIADSEAINKKVRCVYVAPMQALVSVRRKQWEDKFGSLQLRVVELTGETTADLRLLEAGNIIVSTPDHWDTLSRRWHVRKNVQNVDLFVVDELHLIGDDMGPIVEVIVSRMRHISSHRAAKGEKKVRLLGLSSSLANAQDLGEWLGCTKDSLFNFRMHVRPLPLEIHMQGFDHPHFNARMMAMIQPTLSALGNAAKSGKTSIVFVPSKRIALGLAEDILTYAQGMNVKDESENKQDTKQSVSGTGGNPIEFLKCSEDEIADHLALVKNNVVKQLLTRGISILYDEMHHADRTICESLYNAGVCSLLIATHGLCWSLDAVFGTQVVVMGTSYYEGREHRYADYPIADVLQMMGRAGRPGEDHTGKCVLLCHAAKKEFYKKFLHDPLPVESHLDHALHDHLNAEIVSGTIKNKQDAVDYLTWTFFYRRLTRNPNYYNLTGTSHRHVSDHLSETIETSLKDLENANCVAVENEMDIAPLNLGMVAAYYSLKYTTVEIFASSVKGKTKKKGLLEILAYASEYDRIGIRQKESKRLRMVARHLPYPVASSDPDRRDIYTDPHVKTNILLQCYFSRIQLAGETLEDQRDIVKDAPRLLRAMVDVIASSTFLASAIEAMELSQMITQAVWDHDSFLKQLPHFTDALANKCKQKGVENVFQILDMSAADRSEVFAGLSARQVKDIAAACNQYPNIEMEYSVNSTPQSAADDDTPPAQAEAGDNVRVDVKLDREFVDEQDSVGKVVAPLFPGDRTEGWWVVIGDVSANHLLAIKRVAVTKKVTTVALDFVAPEKHGKHSFGLYLISDSYTGCDQEYELTLDVVPRTKRDDDEDDDDVDQ